MARQDFTYPADVNDPPRAPTLRRMFEAIRRTFIRKANLEDSSGLVPTDELASSGTPSSSTFLRGDRSWSAPPGGGGGDAITINGVALVDADFDDVTPAAPGGSVNVKWQKDAGSPANVSAYLDAALALGNNARIVVRKNTGADVGARRRINLIEGANVTLTVTDDVGSEEVDIMIAADAGGAGSTGTATLDFGVFPGKSDASVVVTGQAAIVAGSIVQAWLFPLATADHSADEHLVETIKVYAANISPGVGFTIHGLNSSELNEPLESLGAQDSRTSGAQRGDQGRFSVGGRGTRISGAWTVAWRWS